MFFPSSKALLQTNDVVANEIYSENSNNYTINQNLDNTDCNSEDNIDDNNEVEAMMDVTRVRLVQFQKNTDEPMGITLKMNEENRCIVARILVGGMIHRQGIAKKSKSQTQANKNYLRYITCWR